MDKPKEISVLVADDSSVTRKIISDLLVNNRINVVGEAVNGIEALQMIDELSPDVVVLDIWMPRKNGLEVLQDLFNRGGSENREQKNIPRAVVLSCLIDSDEAIALRCLRLGAVTCIAKPKGGILHTEDFSPQLIQAVREAYVAKPRIKLPTRKEPGKKSKETESLRSGASFVVIGSSTGGPPILEELIVQLPASFNVPAVVVQHMPVGFTKKFAERLDRLSELNISEAKEGDVIGPRKIYIAPGGKNIILRGQTIGFDNPGNFRIKPSIDCFFISAAKQFGKQLIGIILSGMSGDSILGAQAVKENGGWLIVQDPETCMIDGMVKDLIERKLADEILTPEQILERLLELDESLKS